MLVIWIAIAALVMWGFSWAMREARRSRHASAALDILKERYAKGEITKEEYEERRKVIAQE
jgi:putative membrane protein